ncbi:globin-like protein [Dinothrombium tinctorium]|uniref:Globin-like protein n=1 Tax=Dinothrombium tinctorium TaxID=1965070 RepID=A0A443RGT1_9ACAR|nr:globin-like protein [Dinothrombium tinctorium]
MSLTAEEKAIIEKTWSLMSSNAKENSVDLFIRFFTENPSYQKMFKSFADVPMQELRGNKKIAAHAAQVVFAISALVQFIDDTDCLVEQLDKIAERHQKRKVTPKMFENLGTSIVGWLIEKLGTDIMNEQAIEAWKKLYGVILNVVTKHMEEDNEDKTNSDK